MDNEEELTPVESNAEAVSDSTGLAANNAEDLPEAEQLAEETVQELKEFAETVVRK